MLTNKRVALIVGALISLVFLAQTPAMWQMLSRLQAKQVDASVRFENWKHAYEALLPVNKRWVETYPQGVSDLVELYQRVNLERHGLSTDVDRVLQTGSSTVEIQGFDVGLTRLCIGTSSTGGVRLSSPSATTLRQGIESLAARKDIELGSLTFGFDRESDTPYVDVTGLCLRVRSSN